MNTRIVGLLFATIILTAGFGVQSAAQPQQGEGIPTFTTEDVVKSEAPTRREPGPPEAASPSAPNPGVTAIAWSRSANDALGTVVRNQIIVVDVYTDWCGWCKVMDRTVYADPRVARYAADHLFVKLNAEDGAEGQRFATRYGVDGFPTTIVFDGSGRMIAKQSGAFKDAGDFLRWLKQIRQRG